MKNVLMIVTALIVFALTAFGQSGGKRYAPLGLEEGLGQLSSQIASDLSENSKRKIAVIEFADLKGNVTDLGRYLSEKLITELFKTKKFTVVERQLLNKVINEQKLSLTGVIDPTSAQKLGRLLGVDAIAAGSVSDLTKTIEINARLINTGTGEVFSAASVAITKDETVCNLMGGCGNSNTADSYRKETPPSTTENPGSMRVDSNFFAIRLLQCRRSGTAVICDLRITNNDEDKKLGMYGLSSSIIDDANNIAKGGGAELANSRKSSYSTAFLVRGIETKARIYFNGFSQESNKIARMDIKFDANPGKTFVVQFRNIALAR